MYTYIDKIKELINIVEKEEQPHINEAVSLLTTCIEKKNSIYVFGASHAGILAEESFYRAGGLMVINPIFGKEVMLDVEPIARTSKMERIVGYGETLAKEKNFKKGDVVICHSVSGRNPVTIEVAMTAKSSGASVIGITNLKYSKSVTSRHPSGKNMYEYCDVVIDNHGDIGDACVEVDGMEQKVSPTSTVIGATIINTIYSETVKRLVANGMKKPPVFYSANLDGGDELNKKLSEEYKDSIHYKLFN